jgi:ABC-type sugar transport system permease subunit
MKFFLPGMFFLFAFVVGPILYTVAMSGFHYQTGNYISNLESIIIGIASGGMRPDANQTTFDINIIGQDAGKNLEILILIQSLRNAFCLQNPPKLFRFCFRFSPKSKSGRDCCPRISTANLSEQAALGQGAWYQISSERSAY